ncbi:MAG: DEAD/DEAH box helicase, partial [Leptospira sp.]|nr:DEAD/DEAH box helicase [Leptospira sp.]
IHATGISSLLDQKKRIRLMKDFKLGKYKYMVATDVASRGIDVENINVVYNYDLPGDSENYVHRIGRTARAGRKGRSISFCSELDYTELEKIEKFMNQKIEVTNVEEEFLKFPEGNFEKYEVQGEKDFKPGIKKDFHRNGNGNKKFGGKSSRPDRGNFNKKPQHHVARKEGNSSSGGRRPINQLEEAKLYLEKANSVSELLPAKPSVKEKPHREHKEKFSNKKHHPVKHKVKEKTKYDKSKRNLFDINDPVKIETKKTFSIWKKIKSLFGD